MKLTPTDPAVSDALILICEKCGKKLDSNSEENPSRLLQQSLKQKIKESENKTRYRAVTTSCLNICPKNEIAIGIARTSSAEEYFTLDCDEDYDDAAEAVMKKL